MKRIPHLVATVLLSALFVLVIASCGGGSSKDKEVTAIAERLQAIFNVTTSSAVVFVGPVEAGTTVSEDTGTLKLTVPPAGTGTYYIVLIDDAPGTMFEHNVRYGWADIDAGTSATAAAKRRMVLARPGAASAPFEEEQADVIDGIEYTYLSGEGAGSTEDIGKKQEASLPDKLFGRLEANTGGARLPVHKALVFDGGDKSGFRKVAKELSRQNADPMASWLDGHGFDVMQISQYWGNNKPFVRDGNHLISVIQAFGAEFTALGAPAQCDTFFFYMTAHGYESGGACDIYSPDGEGINQVMLYADFLAAFDSFPDWVKVTIQIDNCYGGQMISVNEDKLQELCGKLCALTVITTVDSEHSAWAPSTVHDSGTEDFLDADNVDHDGDGIKGDIRDRFEDMKEEGSWLGPQSFHCPEGTSWCFLDSGEETSYANPDSGSSTSVDDGEFVSIGVTKVEDPGNHQGFVGDPFAQPIFVLPSDGRIIITGNSPFVDVEGTIDSKGNFTATGKGTVAGFSGVTVEMTGTYEDGKLTSKYKMGTKGKLPGGKAITFTGASQ